MDEINLNKLLLGSDKEKLIGELTSSGNGTGNVDWSMPATAKPMTAKNSSMSMSAMPKKPQIIANGDDLILKHEIIGKVTDEYIRFKNVNVSNISIRSEPNMYPVLTLEMTMHDGFDTKDVPLPSHIPADQHARYVQGVFDAKR